MRLATDLHPDLLCLDISRDQWQRRDFEDLPPEYREALLPLAGQTDIVVVPIGGEQSRLEPTAAGWKGHLITALRSWLVHPQRTSPAPAINQGVRHFIADTLYSTMSVLAGRDAPQRQRTHTRHLIQQVVDVSHCDPGCRILVVVNVRFCYLIRPALKKRPEIQVAPYTDL